jgi:hypothetical protein
MSRPQTVFAAIGNLLSLEALGLQRSRVMVKLLLRASSPGFLILDE